jgi:hypothetical protein
MEGAIHKFGGDIAMMLWGAPIALDDDPVHALQDAEIG